MREDIFGIIKRAQKHKIQVFIATNGTLLTKSLIRKLRHVGILGLQISVDGLQSTHDHIRQSPGAFNKLKNVFKDCSRYGIPAYAITGINNENIKELPSLNNTLYGWAASGHQLVRYVPSGTVADTFKCAKSDEFKETLTELRSNMTLPIVSCDPIINMYLGRQYLCGAGYYSVAITTDGFIKVCDTLPKFIGDVRKERFGSIVERSQFISEITLRNQNYLANPSLCDSSRFGCISYQLLASDTLDSQDIYHPNVKLNHPLSIDLKPNGDSKVPFVQEIY